MFDLELIDEAGRSARDYDLSAHNGHYGDGIPNRPPRPADPRRTICARGVASLTGASVTTTSR